jgi:hypothetical protein
MNKYQHNLLTVSMLTEMDAQATMMRQNKMIDDLQCLINGCDNPIIKGVYERALQMVLEGWKC